jgi:diguanylate cyclase (GGDEF)-like protein
VDRERSKAVVVLEGADVLAFPEGLQVHPAPDSNAAALMLSDSHATFLVYREDVEWHVAFVQTLPPERRPATLALGSTERRVLPLCDEWLAISASPAEVERRFELAEDRARMRRKGARRVYLDSLTGLPNRRALVRGLLRESQRARRIGSTLSVVLIDLDGFKQVNDREGHPAGDRLLRKVGAALRRTTRSSEICGRFGGDEFAIVISGNQRQAEQAAQRAAQALQNVGAPGTTAACEMTSDETLKDFYRRADDGLKWAKERRREVAYLSGNNGRPAAVQGVPGGRRAKG